MISLQISLLELFVSKKTACKHEHDDLNMCKDYYSSSREILMLYVACYWACPMIIISIVIV